MTKGTPVLDMALTPKHDALAERPAEINLSLMFERIAANPDVSVDKLQALMDMQRTLLSDRAKVAFSAEMSEAQREMRPVAADATNPQTRSKYASYDALDRKLRPIYTKHGFSLSFDTAESTLPEHVRVLCYVEHSDGHSRTYRVDMPADGKGAKGGDVMTKTHAVGAAMSYGMRYLLKMIFNVAVGEDDRDGNDQRQDIKAPDGYGDWIEALISKADEGLPALQAMWTVANGDKTLKTYVTHLTKTAPDTWNGLKKKAAQIQAVTK